MAMTEERKAEVLALLKEANVPERTNNRPLSKMGGAGSRLREYIRSDYADDIIDFTGTVVVNSTPGLAASFARDIVVLGASVNFFYLQTFANKFVSLEQFPQMFVLEWFEQEGVASPFSNSERFRLETAIAQMIDDGTTFHFFTGVSPASSQWWSRNFIDLLLDNSRLIEAKDADKRDGKRTPIVTPKKPGQENPQGSSRVRIR